MIEKIHKPALERIEKEPDAEGMKRIFSEMISEAEEFGNEVQNVCMPFIDEGDEFVPGTYVPEMWWVVRKVLPDGE